MKRSLLLAILAIALPAAEDWEQSADIAYADLRLGYSVPPRRMHAAWRPTAGGGETSDTVRWSQTGRMELEVVPWPSRASPDGSGLVGLELSSQRMVLESDGIRERLEQRVVQATAHLGIGWVPAPHWTVEGVWCVGLGTAWQPGGDGHGTAYELGARVAALRGFGRFQLGASLAAGWQEWTSSAHLDGADYDLRFSGFGVRPGLIAGWRW